MIERARPECFNVLDLNELQYLKYWGSGRDEYLIIPLRCVSIVEPMPAIAFIIVYELANPRRLVHKRAEGVRITCALRELIVGVLHDDFKREQSLEV